MKGIDKVGGNKVLKSNLFMGQERTKGPFNPLFLINENKQRAMANRVDKTRR